MATLTQRESGWWQARVRRKGRPVESKSFPTKTEAERWARKVESEIDAGVFVSAADAERTTLKDLLDDFETEFAPHHYRQREDRKEAWRFQIATLRQALGEYSLAGIDSKVVGKFRDDRIAGRGFKKKVSESTVQKELYMLSKVLGFAEREKDIHLPRGNPVNRIRKPREGKSRDRRLTGDEWQRLESECIKSRNPWLHAALVLSVETAMRQGELLSLLWKNIDKARRVALLLDTDKIKNEEARAVPLSSRALAVLDKLPRSTSGKVIPVGSRITISKAFEAACERAGIEDYHWHDLRHEALSRLAERGDLSVLEMAAVSGHKTLQMLKRYTHLQAESLARKLG